MSEDETAIPHVREPFIGENMEKLNLSSVQKATLGHISKGVTEMRNQNFILIKDEEAVSHEDWFDDKEEEESNEDEGEAYMSQAKEESVLGLKEAEMVTKSSQGVEGQSLEVVKKEEKESYVET